jgi:hypothetical protein
MTEKKNRFIMKIWLKKNINGSAERRFPSFVIELDDPSDFNAFFDILSSAVNTGGYIKYSGIIFPVKMFGHAELIVK